MDMKKTISLSIIFSLLILGTVFAEIKNDLDITSPRTEFSANPYEIVVYDIIAKNIGKEESTYSVSVDGIPEGWYSLSHETISLKPGETKNVYLFVTPQPTGDTKDTYRITVKFSTPDIAYFSPLLKLNVIKEHKIAVYAPEIVSCLCEASQMAIRVENLGKAPEQIDLTFSGTAIDILEGEVRGFSISPGDSKEFFVKVLPACDSAEKTYDLTINAKSRSSYAEASTTSKIDKKQCFDFDFSAPSEIKTCTRIQEKFPFTISNKGTKGQIIQVSIESLGFSEITDLEPGKNHTFQIPFSKETEGVYETSYKVSNDYISKGGSMRLIVEKCYGVSLELDTAEIIVQQGTGKLTKPTVKNTGSRADIYDIKAEEKWVAIRPIQLSLGSNESQNVYVYYSPEYGAAGTYEVQIKVVSNYSSDAKSVRVKVQREATEQTIKETTITPVEVPEVPEVNVTRPTGFFGRVYDKMEEVSQKLSKWADNLGINKILLSLVAGFIFALIILAIIYALVMRR